MIEDPLLGRDDRALVEPLTSIHSVGGYLEALQQRRLLDLQPVRDASFLLNLWLRRATGHGHFHATNFVLWALIVLLVHRLLRTLPVPPGVALVATCLFAVHPSLAMAVSWVAARKHLLSCLFILLATLGMRRAVRVGNSPSLTLGTLIAYGLSVFAQPITVLWPVWAALVTWREGGSQRRSLGWIPALSLPVMAACIVLNFRYYTGDYVAQVSADKFVEGSHGGVGLLALGRAFFNLVAPVRIATSYDPGSSYNLVGLLLLPAFGLWIVRRLNLTQGLGWTVFALLPLAVVLGRMTHIFLSDPYLLTPGVGLTCLVALLAAPIGSWYPGRRCAASLLSVVTGVGLLVLTSGVARSWHSDAQVWARAYDVAPTPNALSKHAYFLASAGQTEEAFKVGLRLKEWAPAHPEAEYVLSRAIFLDRGLSTQQKAALIAEHGLEGPWTSYFRAVLQVRLGRPQEAVDQISEALEKPEAFKAELPVIVAEATLLCALAHQTSCERFASRFRSHPFWSEPRFRERLKQ